MTDLDEDQLVMPVRDVVSGYILFTSPTIGEAALPAPNEDCSALFRWLWDKEAAS